MINNEFQMSNSFYIIVPSTGAENQTNKFRVQLPRKLILDGPGWTVGLAGIIYPNSWASIGAHEDQFLAIQLKSGEIRHYKIPKGSYTSAKHLELSLYHGIIRDMERRIQESKTQGTRTSRFKRRVNEHDDEAPIHPSSHRPTTNTKKAQSSQALPQNQPTPQPTQLIQNQSMETEGMAEYQKELEYLEERDGWAYALALEIYLQRFRAVLTIESPNLNEHIGKNFSIFKQYYDQIEKGLLHPHVMTRETEENLLAYARAIRFVYHEHIGRFEFICTDERISNVRLTPQIAYALGFEENIKIKNGMVARYAPDIRGAMSQLCVFMNHGVMESIIFGNSFANLLQLVAVEGESGETIQKLFTNPLMHRVVSREIDSMDFEIRSIDGRLVKFDYGQITLTLLFKKAIYF